MLGGEESFVDLGSAKRERTPVMGTASPQPLDGDASRNGEPRPALKPTLIMDSVTAMGGPRPSGPVNTVTAFRVAVIVEQGEPRIRALRADEPAVRGVFSAILIPSDEAASTAIAQLLARGDER